LAEAHPIFLRKTPARSFAGRDPLYRTGNGYDWKSPSLHEAASPFERTRRAIDRDEVIQIPQSRAEVANFRRRSAIAVLIFSINLARI